LGAETFIALDAQYNRDRVEDRDGYSVRAFGGFHVRDAISAFGEVGLEHTRENTGPVARIGLRMKLGSRATAQAEVDTRGTVRSIYQTSGGRGIGTWAASADLARTRQGTTLNANASLLTNRAELSVNQSALYNPGRGDLQDVRTSVRTATSIAFADGAFAVGRPVQDAFLIAGPHRSLKGRAVRINPQGNSASSTSGALGNALEGSLTPYSPRLLIYEVPDAPAGYDLGTSNVQLVPPYKAGYKLEVGSDYHLLVLGRLLDREGQPISLLAGEAFEVSAPKRAAVTMFTSRGGKFGALGLRAGRWRIEMPTAGAPTFFEFEVADDPSGTVRVGDLHPVRQEDEK
jgi:outer membrane usher protein